MISNFHIDNLKKLTVMDTLAPIDFFAKNGFYQVGNKIFNHKIHALQEASQTTQDVHWNFNDEVFNRLVWTQRLQIPLLEIYCMRALQLRQKYEYIIVCWSGGADSTTVLESFLDNDIPVDELLILWPTSLSPGKYTPSLDTKAENFMSEWDFSIKPQLELLQKKHPKLKITIRDTFATPPLDEDHDDTILITGNHSYGTIQKWRELDRVIEERLQQHANVAAVLGVAPVKISILDEYACVCFDDILACPGSKSDYTLTGMPRNIEFFYWTPDFPELVREQAHAIIDQLNVFPNTRNFLNQYQMQSNRSLKLVHNPDPEISRQFLKSMLYPKFPLQIFQVRKPKDYVYCSEWETWFHANPHSEEFLTPWKSAIRAHQALIDEKFLIRKNKQIINYTRFHTQWYPVAHLPTIS